MQLLINLVYLFARHILLLIVLNIKELAKNAAKIVLLYKVELYGLPVSG
jgi:hypothetical protein